MSEVRRKKARIETSPRVVLDTGVLLHALLLNDAKARQLRQTWLGAGIVPIIDTATAQQLMRALAYPPLALDEAGQHELLADFLPYAEAVVCNSPRSRIASPSLKLALSQTGRADWLVSDDAALRTNFARTVLPAENPKCRLLGSDEFLALC